MNTVKVKVPPMTDSTKMPVVRQLHPARNASRRIADLEKALREHQRRLHEARRHAIRLERELEHRRDQLIEAGDAARRQQQRIRELKAENANRADYADYQASVLERMTQLTCPGAAQ